MASSYTLNKNIEKPAYNDYAANPTGWSGPVNDDWDAIDTALGGGLALNATGSVGTVNLTITQTRNLVITITGTMTGNAIYTLPQNTAATAIVGGQWIVYNNTTGSFTVTVSPVSGGGGSIVCRQGTRTAIYSDGTNVALADDRASPGGSNTQIQYNDSGALAGSSKMTFNGTTTTIDTLAVTNAATVGGAITGSSTIADSIGNVRAIPANAQTTAYVLLSSDAGKFISITTGGVTLNTSIFTAGQNVTIYNNSGSDQTITQGAGVTMRQVGTANTGNRTLAQRGLCTLLCVASEEYVITGGGLS
jgi:hypothetical protein